MNTKRTGWMLVWVLAVTSQTAWAGLEWESRRFDYNATPDDDKVIAVYSFSNTGDKPVTITRVKTSCGCSTAKLDQTVYEPGENGQLEVTFKFGNRVGQQKKQIVVTTDHPQQLSTTLELHVEIPRVVSVTPRFVYWRQGGPKTPKNIQIQFDHSAPVQILEIVPSDPTIAARVQTVESGKARSPR